MDNGKSLQPNTTPINPPDKRTVAVALQGSVGGLEGTGGGLPKVVASGYGKLAEQILEMAFEKGIKVRSDADLAQLLATLDLDTPIPSEAIVAVAEILARVYEANARLGIPPETKGSV